jgi:VanZ family protein
VLGGVGICALLRQNRSVTPSDRTVDASLWLAALGCVALTAYYSFWGSPPGAGLFHNADKVGHAMAYFATTLSFLLAGVWRPGRGPGRLPWAEYWLPVAAVVVGIAVEIMQATLTADRKAQIGDVLAEVVGAGLALAIHLAIRRRWRKTWLESETR